MIRTTATALLIAGLSMTGSHTGAFAQPESAQPQPETAPKARVYAYSTPAASRSYLGVDIKDVTADRLTALKLKEERGVEITMVDADAPAGKAGLKTGDVILQFNGAAVDSEEQLRRMIRETPPGRAVTLGISRDGNPQNISLQLADHAKLARRVVVPPPPSLPDMSDLPNRMDIPGNVFVLRNNSALLGVQTENLTRQLGEYFGVKNGEGVLVRSVEKNSPAEKAGLKAGDVIVKVGTEKLSDRGDLSRTLRNYRQGGKLPLGIVREKREQTITVDVPEHSRESSQNSFDHDEVLSLLGSLDDVEPEMDSAQFMAQEGANMAVLRVQPELEKALLQYKKSMKQYEKGMKDYEKNFQHLGDQLKHLDVLQFDFDDMI